MDDDIAEILSAIDNSLSFSDNEGFNVPASNIREDGQLEIYLNGKEYLVTVKEKP